MTRDELIASVEAYLRGDAKTFAGVKDEDEAWWTVDSLIGTDTINALCEEHDDAQFARDIHEVAVMVVERGDWDDILSS